MTDRLTVITHLKQLAQDTAQRGEDRAAAILDEAAQMLYEDGAKALALEHRRRADAGRQERHRESRKSRDVTLRNVTNVTPPGFSPTPPFPTPQPPRHTATRAREASRAANEPDVGSVYAESVENLQSLLRSQMGDECYRDADAFLARREYTTWGGWIKEMLSLLTGGKAMAADLAQVCRDDAALRDPIGTPRGLRGFLASAVRDRENAGRPPARAGAASSGSRSSGTAGTSIGARAFATAKQAIEDL